MQNPSTYGYDVVFRALGNLEGRIVWDRKIGLTLQIPEQAAQGFMSMLLKTGYMVPLGSPNSAPPPDPIHTPQAPEPDEVATPVLDSGVVATVTDTTEPVQVEIVPAAATALSSAVPSLENPMVAAAPATSSGNSAIAALDWIPSRTRTALINAGLPTAEMAFAKSDAELLKIKGVGKGFFDACVTQIAQIRADLGIQVPDAVSAASPPAPEVQETPPETAVTGTTPNIPSPYQTQHEGIAVTNLQQFRGAEPGYMITRQDGMRVRFNPDHTEVTRVPGDPTPAAAGLPPMTGFAGAAAPAVAVTLTPGGSVTPSTPPVPQGGGLLGSASLTPAPVAAAPTPAVVPTASNSSLPPEIHAAVFGAHTIAQSIGALKRHGMDAVQVASFLTENLEALPYKASVNAGQLATMVPAIFGFSS